jgi:gamma-glutamylcyclotransferase (GGCT)/AIG2-like uncharacterized protein YtfP
MPQGAPGARVFVYGTLMPGESRWPLLLPFAAEWEPATAPGGLWDTANGYPAARFDDLAGEVPGYVVVLDARRATDALGLLDRVEGEGVLFRRVTVTTSAGPAMGYEWLGPTGGLVRLPDGWRYRS